MTLLHLDGCDEIATIPGGWIASGSPTLVPGRFANCYRTVAGQAFRYDVSVAERTDTMTIGFAVQFTTPSGSPPSVLLASWQSGPDTHVYLRLNVDRSLTLIHGSLSTSGILLGLSTPPAVFTVNTWHYVEATVRVHDTTGTATLVVDGPPLVTATGRDTANGATLLVDTLRFGVLSGTLALGQAVMFDDVYVRNDNVRLGDTVIETLLPSGNGIFSQWSGSDGNNIDNWRLVSELPMSTANYTSGAAVGDKDLYDYPPLKARTGTPVKAIEHLHVLDSLGGGGSDQARLLHRAADGSIAASAWVGVGDIDTAHPYVLETNPQTSGAWTVTAVNTIQGGVENGVGDVPAALGFGVGPFGRMPFGRST